MQEQINQLQNQINQLQAELLKLRDAYFEHNYPNEIYFYKDVVFKKNFIFSDGTNIPTGSTTGTKIATSSTQKLGFYGATPIVRPSAIGAPSGGATQDAESRNAINSIRTALTNLGLTA